MTNIESLVMHLDNLHSEYMNVNSVYDLGLTFKIYKKGKEHNFNEAGHFDFLDKNNFPVIYIHEAIIKYAPLSIIQYVLAHEVAHVIQEIYYKDLLLNEYPLYKWHGPSFNKILEIFGYNKLENIEEISIPNDLSTLIKGGDDNINKRYSLNKWKKEGGTCPPIIFN
jgi:hypothetical protein